MTDNRLVYVPFVFLTSVACGNQQKSVDTLTKTELRKPTIEQRASIVLDSNSFIVCIDDDAKLYWYSANDTSRHAVVSYDEIASAIREFEGQHGKAIFYIKPSSKLNDEQYDIFFKELKRIGVKRLKALYSDQSTRIRKR